MKLIVGLGNPGLNYKNTRHNIGFNIVEKVALDCNLKFKRDSIVKSFLAKDIKKDLLIVKPLTFMNLSGIVVKKIIKNYNVSLEDLLVVYDDVDLNFARLKFTYAASSGGHKGLQSIIDSVESLDFSRLRFGIGHDDACDTSDYVLSKFNKDQKKILGIAIEKAAQASLLWFEAGIKKTMDKYN